MEIKAKEIVLFPTENLQPYHLNANDHTDEQINKIVELIEFYGHRDPLIVDFNKNSNGKHEVIAGCGRLAAANKVGWDKLPVVFQSFKSEEEKYGFMVSHNAINSSNWGGGLNLSKINSDIAEFGPELEIEMLAIKDFVIEPAEIDLPDLKAEDPSVQQVTFVLSNEQKDILDEAMKKAKKEEDCSDELNQNSNGNTLAAILKRYVYG